MHDTICTDVRTPGAHLPCKIGVSACHRSESVGEFVSTPLAVRVMKKDLAG